MLWVNVEIHTSIFNKWCGILSYLIHMQKILTLDPHRISIISLFTIAK